MESKHPPPTLRAWPNTYLLVRFFEVFHEHRDDDVDEDKLRHENEDDEKEGGEVWRDAAVLEAIVVGLAFLPQGVLNQNDK